MGEDGRGNIVLWRGEELGKPCLVVEYGEDAQALVEHHDPAFAGQTVVFGDRTQAVADRVRGFRPADGDGVVGEGQYDAVTPRAQPPVLGPRSSCRRRAARITGFEPGSCLGWGDERVVAVHR
jgi:hypothetical protein